MPKIKLTERQKETLKMMQRTNQHTIYVGLLGVEGVRKFGMSISGRIRRGTAKALIKNGLAELIDENSKSVRLTDLGKTINLD